MSDKINQDIDCNSTVKESKMKKFWIIFVLLLVLLIPISMLGSVIDNRESYKREAVNNIASSWGKAQEFKVPFLYFKQIKKDKTEEEKHLLLHDYDANVNIKTEVRKKGFFKIPVYTANVVLKGTFKNEYGDLSGKKLKFGFGVSDSRGFLDDPVFKLGDKPKESVTDMVQNVTINGAPKMIPFEISYNIRGLNNLYVDVKGQNNKVKIAGDWPSPSFEGDFLPVSRKVENGMFEAEWATPKIATLTLNYPDVGVSLLLPIDNYRMAERTLKYAFLFLSLTFTSYFLFELISKEKRKIHPLQYFLLGGAMLVFYLLLVSMSEFLSFTLSYVISTFMTISLIGTYTYMVITKKQGKIFSLSITLLLFLLYLFLYILLHIEDFALLFGSLGIFAIIAIMMYASRNVNWYAD